MSTSKKNTFIGTTILSLLLLSLSGCGGGGAGGNGSAAAGLYTVGGTVNGLTATGLVLQLNGGDDRTVNADGNFIFAAITDGSSYEVTVKTQPGGGSQTCTVSGGSGVIASANITDVSVSCQATPTYTVSGTVHGMNGTVWCCN